MMSEAGTAGQVGVQDPGTNSSLSEKPKNGKETSWVKFDGAEDREAATIQPSSMEVVAMKETGDKKPKDESTLYRSAQSGALTGTKSISSRCRSIFSKDSEYRRGT